MSERIQVPTTELFSVMDAELTQQAQAEHGAREQAIADQAHLTEQQRQERMGAVERAWHNPTVTAKYKERESGQVADTSEIQEVIERSQESLAVMEHRKPSNAVKGEGEVETEEVKGIRGKTIHDTVGGFARAFAEDTVADADHYAASGHMAARKLYDSVERADSRRDVSDRISTLEKELADAQDKQEDFRSRMLEKRLVQAQEELIVQRALSEEAHKRAVQKGVKTLEDDERNRRKAEELKRDRVDEDALSVLDSLNGHKPNVKEVLKTIEIKAGLAEKEKKGEDTNIVDTELDLYAVFDGVGGQPGGGNAAAAARNAIHLYYKNEVAPASLDQAVEQMKHAFSAARLAVPDSGEVGLTTAAVTRMVNIDGCAYLIAGNAGDSRIVRQRNGQWSDVTTEQCHGNELTNSLGSPEGEAKDQFTYIELQAGDKVLICSDGITGDWEDQKLTEAEWADAFGQGDPEASAARFVELSKKNDDKTAIVLFVDGETATATGDEAGPTEPLPVITPEPSKPPTSPTSPTPIVPEKAPIDPAAEAAPSKKRGRMARFLLKYTMGLDEKGMPLPVPGEVPAKDLEAKRIAEQEEWDRKVAARLAVAQNAPQQSSALRERARGITNGMRNMVGGVATYLGLRELDDGTEEPNLGTVTSRRRRR